MEKKTGKKKIMNHGVRGMLHVLQHISIVAAGVLLLYVILGSTIWVENDNGTKVYHIPQEDTGTEYEDSLLFNEILGENISDIICYGVIRGQMEDYGRFNGQKEIDVTAFVNRYNGIPKEYITARYYLEDLLKWAQNGFNYKWEFLTGKEADEFLSRSRTVTSVDFTSDQYSGDAATYLNSNMESVTRTYDVSGNVIIEDGPLRDDVDVQLLINMYQTVDKKNLEKYVSSWEEYFELCKNTEAAAADLLVNYGEYEKYGKLYDADNSNIRYCIRKTVGDNTEVYSNLSLQGNSIKEIEKVFYENCNKYVYYNPSDMKYETNTLIQEDTLRYIVKGFQYAYPENTQIWIGVDTKYPAYDLLSQGHSGFNNYVPYYGTCIGFAIAFILLYLLLLTGLTASTGKAADDEGKIYIKLRKEDRIPTEIMILLNLAAGACLACGALAIVGYMPRSNYYAVWFIPVCGAFVFVCSLAVSFFYYSFIRRIKAGKIWTDSLIRKIFLSIKGFAVYAYDNGTVILRVWVPILFLIVLHEIVLLFCNREITICILIFVVVDTIIGWLVYRSAKEREDIVAGIKRIKEGDLNHKVEERKLHGDNLVLAQAVNSIGDGIRSAVETSMKDERMKTDLITNVSHDIKTPLTSIINYIDLIKRENIENTKVKGYVEVLDAKSQRLKQLTDDLVEASKISSGNIFLELERINLVELLNQTIGEFSEKFQQKALDVKFSTSGNNMLIEADSRRIWRVIENLFNNIYKYAQENTRIYIDITEIISKGNQKHVVLSIKNISALPLNVSADELTERFIRGDVARTTEGSGLGLSIAKSLTEAQNGSFEIRMDGDLFKVMLTFPLLERD